MNISAYSKRLSVAVLVLGVAVGCASTAEKTTTEKADACKGPTPEVTAAINEAESAITKARSMGTDWMEADQLADRAQKAAMNCNYDKAMRLAEKAEAMAQDSIAAYKAKQEQQQQEQMAMEEDQMEKQYDIYAVKPGDSLWDISAKPKVYNNPYMWPLIYKANQNTIRDPDLIYPYQEFRVWTSPTAEAANLAIHHAKTRGAWSIGELEYSDTVYLRKARNN